MIPIQDLLHRIQWDSAFGKAEFEIGYVDRVAGSTVRVPFRDVRFEHGQLVVQNDCEEDGSHATVPLHRVREVWRDGQLIWLRASLKT
jgi:uncharacterized protein (UPF0248 family)